ncbi:MAG: V-type ATPase subunit [Thermodesulfovibrionales bacterium]
MRNKFLLELPQKNYPEEYFISRIRGGRSRLIKDWNIPLYSTDLTGLLRASHYEFSDHSFIKPLLKRYRWLYSEMNDRLREVFWPYFLLYELRTLIICLRYIKTGHNEDAEDLLRISLLSGEIRDIILFPDDFDTTVRRLMELLSEEDMRFLDGYEIFHKKGLQEFERFIHGIFLQYLLSLNLQKHIKTFITYQIDSRNILSLYKSIKWEIMTPPEFLSGGELNLRGLERILIQRDLNLFSSILRRLTGLSGEREGASIEDLLLKGLSLKLRKRSYEDNTGLILHYLWSLYIEFKNLGTILSATGIERAELKEEIL